MGYKKRTLTLTGSATATGNVIPSTPVEDFSAFALQAAGTFVATLVWYGSNDGQTWYAIRAQDAQNPTTIGGSTTVPGLFRGPLGVRYFKVDCTAYTSGTATAIVLLSPDPMPAIVKST